MTQKLKQAALCLLCGVVVWRYGSSLEGTEFSGGRLTGPLLAMMDAGALLLVAALLMVFFYRRIAAAVSVIAVLLCLPLYLYFAAPGTFRWFFRGDYSVPLRANPAWDTWTVVGILLLVGTASFSVRALLSPEDSSPEISA